MSRTSKEIEDEIEAKVSQYQEELSELKSNKSMVAFWPYVKKIVAFVALTIEKFFDQHKIEIESIIEKTETGSIDWYRNLCYNFQYGDRLVIEDNRPVYPKINKDKQIIKRVSIKEHEEDLSLIIKVVKEEKDELTKLSGAELDSFKYYLNRSKIVGTKLEIGSTDPDHLELKGTLLLDPMILNKEGERIADGKEMLISSIKDHLKVFDFGGTFYLSRLIKSVMSIEGVKDFQINTAKLNDEIFDQSKESPAGYIKLDTQNTTLEYVFS